MRRGTRVKIAAAVTVLALAILVTIGYRVLAPSEMLTSPTVRYPGVVTITDDRPYSELRAAPLVVEGRLRVYAEKWRVWTDAPVGERYEATPYWAYRRWPAQVVGVLVAETTTGPVVVSQWSDGKLVAVDARLGKIRWKAAGPVAASRYDGRRTGATVVYEPRSLVVAKLRDRAVVVASGPGGVRAFDAHDGAQLWRRDLPAGCEPRIWTGATLVAVPDCATRAVTLVGVVDGRDRGRWVAPGSAPAQPTLCALGRSECRLVAVGSKVWLLRADGTLTSVPALEPGSVLAGDRVVYPTSTGVAARRLTDGVPLWTWNGTGELIAADTVGVYLLTDDRTVLGLSPVTGHLTVLGCATSLPNEGWRVGHVHPTDGSYLALERLTNEAASAPDRRYFYGPRPVALVELYPPTKLPVWPGKFAACNPDPV